MEAVEREGQINGRPISVNMVTTANNDKGKGKEVSSAHDLGTNKPDLSCESSSNKDIIYPLTAYTEYIQGKGGPITMDLGLLQFIPHATNNRHGPDIDNNSIYESGEDTNIENIEEGFTDNEEVAKSIMESTEEEDEQIDDSLTEIVAPVPKHHMDPLNKETEEVIQRQVLSPRGNKKRNHKGKGGLSKPSKTIQKEVTPQIPKLF